MLEICDWMIIGGSAIWVEVIQEVCETEKEHTLKLGRYQVGWVRDIRHESDNC